MRRTRRTGGRRKERRRMGRKRRRRGEGEEVRKKKTTTRITKMMTLAFIQSTKFQIALILVSLLRLHFLSKVIPQTLINVQLTVPFRLEIY